MDLLATLDSSRTPQSEPSKLQTEFSRMSEMPTNSARTNDCDLDDLDIENKAMNNPLESELASSENSLLRLTN